MGLTLSRSLPLSASSCWSSLLMAPVRRGRAWAPSRGLPSSTLDSSRSLRGKPKPWIPGNDCYCRKRGTRWRMQDSARSTFPHSALECLSGSSRVTIRCSPAGPERSRRTMTECWRHGWRTSWASAVRRWPSTHRARRGWSPYIRRVRVSGPQSVMRRSWPASI